VTTPDGVVVAELQQPPAPGSATSAWPRFTWVLAPVAFDLPNQLTAGPYAVNLTFVGEGGASLSCGTVADLVVTPRPRVFELPEPPTTESADFAGTIGLLGYQVMPDDKAQTLLLTIWWRAKTSPPQDLKRFVHLYDPVTEIIVAQDDAMPRDWRYPTSWWATGEIVSETIALATTGIPDGTYRIGVGWYDPESLTRLPATLVDGTPVPNDRVTLGEPVVLPAGSAEGRRWPWAVP
jgi:hypothetical protein